MTQHPMDQTPKVTEHLIFEHLKWLERLIF